jgi:hypothetical protein
MKTKKFESIIEESPYKNYFEKVSEETLGFLWSNIEGDPLTKVPINAYKSIRQNGFAVVMTGVGTNAHLYVLLDDWKVYKSKPDNDTLATLMPKVQEIETYLMENSVKKKRK